MTEESTVRISVDTDGSTARVHIPASFDPAALTVSLLAACAAGAGVRISAQVHAGLAQAADQFRRDPSDLSAVVARATPPVHGNDGELLWQPGFDPSPSSSEPVAENSAVDHYAGRTYVRVAPGDHVATLRLPTPGEDGSNVLGEVLKARPGRPCTLRPEAGFEIDAENRVIAVSDGVLAVSRGALSITKLLEVKGYVDFETGNIDFDGSVDIREGVRDRFVVKATGNVTIGGLIESATIECGGDLSCGRGAAARDRGTITVGGNVDIGFLNNTRGMIGGTLSVRREIINCDLAIDGTLLGEPAALIGGLVVAGADVSIGTLGSDGDRATVLRVGAMPVLADRLRECERAADGLRARIARLNESLIQAGRLGRQATASDRERMTELSYEIDDLTRLLHAEEEQCAALRAIRAAPRRLNVRVGKCIHPGVRIESDSAEIVFEQMVRGPVHLSCDGSGEVTFRIGDGPPRPVTEIAVVRRKRPAATGSAGAEEAHPVPAAA